VQMDEATQQNAALVEEASALASYVTEHALGIERPVREYYLVGPLETPDASA
jgi:methyl-accepting chemotaxis protein